MEILRLRESDVPQELWNQVVTLERQAWPGTDGHHDPALRPLTMLALSDGMVVASLAVLTTTITHAGRDFRVCGLSSVVTDQALRGTGVGRTLVLAARAEIERSGADLGIFTCDTELRRFYESAGWATLPGAVLVGGTVEDPFPSDQFDKIVLTAFFTPDAVAARSSFEHSRIELYPGTVDRLW